MEYMTINVWGLILALVTIMLTIAGTGAGGLLVLWHKLDKIWQAINQLQLNNVTVESCKEMRKDCPYMKIVDDLKEKMEAKDV